MSQLVLASASAIGGGLYFIYNKFLNNNSQNQEAERDIESTNADIKSSAEIANIINNNDLNTTKRNFIVCLYEYLQNYNDTFANKHIDSKTSTKPAITVEEVVSELLVYKNYDKEQLFKIFGYDNFSSEDMYNAYMSSVEYEAKAHTIQKESLNKNFIKGKKKDIYDKYEGLMINYNIQNTKERKIEVAKQFWNEVRNDIDVENTETLPKNMEVILPIIKAMKKICKNLDIAEKLNSKEYEWYLTECDQRIREKLYDYDVQLKEVATVNKRLGATVAMSFNEIKDTIINQLKNEGTYNVEDYERDISDHKEYKIAIAYFKKQKEGSSSNNENIDTRKESEDSSNDYGTNDSDISSDNKKDSDKNKSSKSNKKRNSKSNKQSNQSDAPDDEASNDGDSYDSNNDENYNDDEDTNGNNDTNNDSDYDNDTYTDQDETENKSDGSKYPGYIKDITDDESGAYEDFPNLNSINKKMTKSQYADYIISNMENQKVDPTPKVNLKRI